MTPSINPSRFAGVDPASLAQSASPARIAAATHFQGAFWAIETPFHKTLSSPKNTAKLSAGKPLALSFFGAG
jgi:hypothetical protein